MKKSISALLAGALLPFLTAARAETPELPPMQVTATRTAGPVQVLPASMTVISGADLRARGATDLRGALAGVAGVEISAGGDNGPAGSVPAFWGLSEFDAFLLVVDGVPAGGAFNPALVTLDLTNVERIEVMRGSAPVMFGATSFVGVIHVIHYAAGRSESRAWASAGSHASWRAGASGALGDLGSWKQSLSGNAELRKLSDDDADIGKSHLMWRTGGELGSGSATFDLDLTRVVQSPDSPVAFDESANRFVGTPLDANHNPTDAEYTESRIQVNGGYRRHTGWGEWASLLSLAFTRADTLRGFLEVPGTEATSGGGPENADGYDLDRKIGDLYFDTHFELPAGPGLELAYGVDALVGVAKQIGEVFEYTAAFDGSPRDSSAGATQTKFGEGEGERVFAGAYVQADWQPADTLNLLAGLRFNLTNEMREGEREEDDGMGGIVEIVGKEKQKLSRLSGMLGASWRFWEAGESRAQLYADVRDSFKPAAFEFGPEIESTVPKAETARSWEAGVKSVFGGVLETDVAWFHQDFRNVFLLEGNDIRKTRLQGAEAEATWHAAPDVDVRASYAYHRARFVDAAIDTDDDFTNGAELDIGGNTLAMAPESIASLGLLWNPRQGLYGGAGWNHTGSRFLNKANTATAAAYDTIDAVVGWRHGRVGVALQGGNLTDEREPVSESEFAALPFVANAPSYYLLPARHVELMLNYDFGS